MSLHSVVYVFYVAYRISDSLVYAFCLWKYSEKRIMRKSVLAIRRIVHDASSQGMRESDIANETRKLFFPFTGESWKEL